MAILTSTANNASAVETVAKIQGELTISSSTTAGFTAVEDITGITTMYILDATNTSDYVAIAGTVAGTVGSQVFTYAVANGSAATAASDEKKWATAQLTVSDKPKEITVHATSTSTSLKSIDAIATGDSVLLYNATDGAISAQDVGTVTQDAVSDGSTNSSTTDSVVTMTSNTAPSGLAFADKEASASLQAWKVFDDTSDSTGWESTNNTGIVGYKYVSAIAVNKFTIQAEDNALGAARSPNTFTLQGSNNTTTGLDVTWTTLETYSSETFTQNQERTFTLTNGTSYSAYRLNITANNGDTFLGIKEAQFIEAETLYEAPVTGLTVAPTKAFFNKHTKYRLAVEDTANRCILKANEHLTVDATTDATDLVVDEIIYEGETIYTDEGDAVLGAVIVNGYNLASPVDNGDSYDFTSQSTAIKAINFNDDGLIMYLFTSTGETIYQYTLTTPYDVTTATYASKSATLTTQSAGMTDVQFKTDGTKFYALSEVGDTLYQYSLSTAWDISTASYDSVSKDISNATSKVYFKVSPDGTKMLFPVGTNGLEVYTLSTAWDLSTATISSTETFSEEANVFQVDVSSDGLKLFFYGNITGTVFQYTLSSSWAISTASYDSVSFSPLNGGAIFNQMFNADGTKLYEINQASTIYQYDAAISYSAPHNLGAVTPTTAYRKGGEDLTFVSSTTSEYVGTNPISGLLATGDTIQLDGATEVATSNVVESPAGTYTCTIPVQGSAPTSSKVLDRSVDLTTTHTYNATDNDFDVTMASAQAVSGRAMKLGFEQELAGSSVDIDNALVALYKE